MIKGLHTELNPSGTSELDVEQLIAAPLIAASKANSVMAKEQARFLLEFCFSQNGDHYRPVMIDMHLTRSVLQSGDSSDEPHSLRKITTIFQVPLMTIIPINSLAVETVDVEFDLEISSQHTIDQEAHQNQSEEKNADAGGKAGGGLFGSKSAKLKGKISYDSKEASSRSDSNKYMRRNASKLKVKIHAGQLPLPLGVTTMLNAYSKSMLPKSVDHEDENQ